MKELSVYSRWKAFLRSVRKNGLAYVFLWILAGVIAVGFLGPFIAPFDPSNVGVSKRFHAISFTFPMGTDNLGRDVFSRFLWGARTSLIVGFSAAAASPL